MRVKQASLLQVVERGSTGTFPGDFAFVKKIEMSAEGTAWFGRAAGESTHHPVAAGKPDGVQTCFALPTKVKEDAIVLG